MIQARRNPQRHQNLFNARKPHNRKENKGGKETCRFTRNCRPEDLLAQVTDEKEIREMVNNGKATFYIGFDPTADSLHVGHFMALCLMKRLQMAGNKPIALLGGGTGHDRRSFRPDGYASDDDH